MVELLKKKKKGVLVSQTFLFWLLFHSWRGDADRMPLAYSHCPGFQMEQTFTTREKSTDLGSWLVLDSYCTAYTNGDTDILNTNYNKLSSLAWPAEQLQEKTSKYTFLSQTLLLAQFWVGENHFCNQPNKFIP